MASALAIGKFSFEIYYLVGLDSGFKTISANGTTVPYPNFLKYDSFLVPGRQNKNLPPHAP
jgi:hypothetical protein